jgi:hypothetical protein
VAQIEFRGYSGDCVIQGRLSVPDDVRLTDFLNSVDAYAVTNTSLFALEDGHRVDAAEQSVPVDEIWAVEPPDSSMRADLHVPTREVEIEVELPPYRINGFLHGVNTGDPLAAIGRRRRMIPLTDAILHFSFGGSEMAREMPVLIFNRERATSVRRVTYERTKLDEMPLPPVDPNARDLTGMIRDESE